MTPELMKKQMTEFEWQKVYDMSKDKNLYHNLCSSLFPTIHGLLCAVILHFIEICNHTLPMARDCGKTLHKNICRSMSLGEAAVFLNVPFFVINNP